MTPGIVGRFQRPAVLVAVAVLFVVPHISHALRLANANATGVVVAPGTGLQAPLEGGMDVDEQEGLNLVQVAAYRLRRGAERAPKLRRALLAMANQAKLAAGISLALLVFICRARLRQLGPEHKCAQEDKRPLECSLNGDSSKAELLLVNRPQKNSNKKGRPPETSVLQAGRAGRGSPTELAEVPPPMRRLRNIGASYVIPRAFTSRTASLHLSFDIPTQPCVWPLRAQLSRPMPKGPWAKIQLTVDIIAASGLPPLLTCARTSRPVCLEDSGGTGGTGEEGGAGIVASEEEEECGCPDLQLEIHNAAGTVVATILRHQNDGLVLQRQDRSVWDIDADLEGKAPRMTISKQGQEMGQATGLGPGVKHLQLDTQPDVQSPESCVLLMCMLAVLVFKP